MMEITIGAVMIAAAIGAKAMCTWWDCRYRAERLALIRAGRMRERPDTPRPPWLRNHRRTWQYRLINFWLGHGA